MASKSCDYCGVVFSDPKDYGKVEGYLSDHNHECPKVRGAVELPQIDSHDFACHCGTKGREEIRLVREWLYERLNADATNLVTKVAYNLEFDYSASITGIYCDMWSGIVASTHDNEFSVSMSCDDIEDGFAYVYKAFFDHFGDEYEYDIEKAKAEREKGR